MVKQNSIALVLHKIVDDSTNDWEDIKKEKLEQILLYIRSSCSTFCEDRINEKNNWMLTFDDGYSSDYEIVFPLLSELDIKATFFVITDRVGRPGYLSWNQIQEMHDYGMCFGSHSCSHSNLLKISKKNAEKEFCVSKEIIENKIGSPINAFSFPMGLYNHELIELGLLCGYSFICNSDHGIFSYQEKCIPRNSINSSMEWKSIRKVLDASRSTQFRWTTEDLIKRTAKDLIGHKNYILCRNKMNDYFS